MSGEPTVERIIATARQVVREETGAAEPDPALVIRVLARMVALQCRGTSAGMLRLKPARPATFTIRNPDPLC